MTEALPPVRDLLLQVEKTLRTYHLYSPGMPPYEEAGSRLFEKFAAAAGDDGLNLRVAATELFVGKTSVMQRDDREQSFFFPLFRDGLRELQFSAELTREELDRFVLVLEEGLRDALGATEDTVSHLWRSDLAGIRFTALDGIGDEEGGESPESGSGSDLGGLVSELVAQIEDPAAPELGQTYNFHIDADSRLDQTDLHYEASTSRQAFEDNPTILSLTGEEAEAIRAEATAADHETELLGRYAEILGAALTDPAGAISEDKLGAAFERLLAGYWESGSWPQVQGLLASLHRASCEAPLPESREVAARILAANLTDERIGESLDKLASGELTLDGAKAIWQYGGGDMLQSLLHFHGVLPQGELRTGISQLLRERLADDPHALRTTLASDDSTAICLGLSFVEVGGESCYDAELVPLCSHRDESVRLKAATAVARSGSRAAVDALWRVMEKDRSNRVRLLAFRLMAGVRSPEREKRIHAILTHDEFAARPLWEREKYVKLYAATAGELAFEVFEPWLPRGRWLWGEKTKEAAELALAGYAAVGGTGLGFVEELAREGGKLGAIATKVLAGGNESR